MPVTRLSEKRFRFELITMSLKDFSLEFVAIQPTSVNSLSWLEMNSSTKIAV